METVLVDPQRKAEWDEFVYNNPDTISWHVYDWHKILKDHYRLPYYPLAVYDGGRVVGILPLYHVRTWRLRNALISIPYFVAGGIVAENPAAKRLLLEKAIELSARLGSAPIILKQYGSPVDSDDLGVDTGFYNLELTLSTGTDRLWAEIAEDNKQQVTLSRQWDLELEYPSGDLDAYYRLLSDHHHRAGVPGPSKAWVRSLLDSQMYSIALLHLNGSIAAGTLVKTFKDTVSFPLTALRRDDETGLMFAYRLYWDLIVRQAAEGMRIFHSGRIPNHNDVPVYRLGWGGEQHRYYYQYYGYSGQTEKQSKRGRGRQVFEQVWRRIPRPIAQAISPVIVRQFP